MFTLLNTDVHIKITWTIGVLGFDSRRGLGIFIFTTGSKTAPGPIYHPIQRAQGALPLGGKAVWARSRPPTPTQRRGQRMCGATPPLPQYAL